jgi:hypothetical protein
MRRHPRPQPDAGTASLVIDRLTGTFHCYWYDGLNDDRLREHARVANATDAVAWGRRRTSHVRIRTGDARSYWAGTGLRPAGFTNTWSGSSSPDAG